MVPPSSLLAFGKARARATLFNERMETVSVRQRIGDKVEKNEDEWDVFGV
jgi:hypothetical protein